MHSPIRIFALFLLLASAARAFAQADPANPNPAAPAVDATAPAVPGVQPSAQAPVGASNTNLQSIMRRLRSRTNEAAAAASPAAASNTMPAFPTLPMPPPVTPRRRALTNVASTAAQTSAVPTAVAGSTNLATTAPATTPSAASPAANPPSIPIPSPTGPVVAVPAPTNAPATGFAGQIPGPSAMPAPAANALTETNAPSLAAGSTNAPSSNPLNPELEPGEIIPGGTVSLQGMPLEQYFDLYSLYSGRTILRPYALQGAPQGLTLKAQTDLTRLEVVIAMDAVLALNGITMIPVGEKFVKAVPSNIADKEGMEISHTPAADLPMTEQFLTRIVKLKTAKPSEIAPTLQGLAKTPTAVTPIDSNQTLILRDYSSNIRRMLEIIEKIDVMPESDYTFEVLPIKYGKVMDIYASMSQLISGAGGGSGAATAAASAGSTISGGAGGFGRTGGGGFGRSGGFGGSGSMGGSGYGNTRGGSGYGGGYGNTRGGSGYGGYGGGYYPQQLSPEAAEVFPQQAATTPSPGAAQGNFQQRLNQIVNRAANPDQVKILENAQIVPDERSNKLLIFANKRDMSMITNIVAKVDVMLAQVLIEAIILEVKLGDSLRYGVSATQAPKQFGQDFRGAGAMNNGQLFSSITNFPVGAPSGFSYFGSIGQDWDVAITALAQDNQVDILSRPRIQTSHAIPGFFFIGETVPYVTGSYDYGYVGSVGSRSIVNERQVGLTLDVTPFITPEGMVVMEVSQDFQQRGQDVIIDGNPIPLVNSRSAAAVLTVRSGDLIMLGGFISDSKSKSKSGVPILKDIPGLGALFRSTSKSNDRTELIILMKATVIDTPEAAAIVARREKSQLPSLREAEHDFEQSTAKRGKKIDKRIKR